MDKYELEYIDKLRIHELRDYAKKIGISSPTTMKKDELIGKIIAIVDSNSENYSIKDNKNDKLNFFEILTLENSNVLEDLLASSGKANGSKTMVMRKNNINKIDDMFPFSFKIGQTEAPYGDSDIMSCSGYIDIHPDGYGILRYDGFVPCDKDIYFPSSLVRNYNLKKGQFVTGNTKIIIEGKPRVMHEITDIQDVNSFKSSRDFASYEHNGLGEELYIDKFKYSLKKGERHYVENLSLNVAVELGKHIAEENSEYCKFINIKARPEEFYKSDGKFTMVNIPFNKNEVEVINTVDLILERVMREFEIKKQNVIIIYNFSELVRIINVAFEGCLDFSKFNAKAINKIYNILYVAKHTNSNLNCSIICIDKNGIARDMQSIIELEFMPLFNKIHKTIEK